MGRFDTTISESPDTTEFNVMAKKSKTTVSDDYEDNGTMDDPTEPVVEEEKIDPENPDTQPKPQWQEDQTFKPLETYPAPEPGDNLEGLPLSESTKAEMAAGVAAGEAAKAGSESISEAEGKAGRANADKYNK